MSATSLSASFSLSDSILSSKLATGELGLLTQLSQTPPPTEIVPDDVE